MPQGLQVMRADGSISLDVTDRIAKIVGSYTIDDSTNSGTIYNSELGDGEIWWFFTTLSYPSANMKYNTNKTWESPTITKGDKCINWSFPTDRHISGVLLYGVF